MYRLSIVLGLLAVGSPFVVAQESPREAASKKKKVVIVTSDGKVYNGTVVDTSGVTKLKVAGTDRVVEIPNNQIEEKREKKTTAKDAGYRSVRTRTGVIAIPNQVDPDDKTERMLLMIPRGLLVVDIDATINDRPFRVYREEVIEKIVNKADEDKNGRLTFDEVFRYPTFATGRFAAVRNDAAARKRVVQQFDYNRDGLANKTELRVLLSIAFGAPAFSLTSYGSAYGGGSPVVKLLDQDKDGTVSASEIGMAERQLKARDADDNDILTLSELTGTIGNPRVQASLGVGRGGATVVHLYPTMDFRTLYRTLVAKYGSGGKLTGKEFSRTPNIFKSFDDDGNETVENQEFNHLLTMKPHLHLNLAFGRAGDRSSVVTVKSIAKDLDIEVKKSATSPARLTLVIGDCNIELLTASRAYPTFSYEAQAKSVVSRYDKNKNGYLEKDELGEQASLANQFRLWDANGDAKVYPNEIEAMYERSVGVTMNRVSVGAVDRRGWLVPLIDTNNDGRIGLREMRAASENLKQADANGDGLISAKEVPHTIKVAIATGYDANQLLGEGQQTPRATTGTPRAVPSGDARGPLWFAHMDRNGDGDLTLREFLGDEKQFKELDANQDGFIERKEALAAKP